jgi:hypothetical protein
MRVATNGYVGIGTATPSAKLEVDGNVVISGNLLVNGTPVVAVNPDGSVSLNDLQSNSLVSTNIDLGNGNSLQSLTDSGGAKLLFGGMGTELSVLGQGISLKTDTLRLGTDQEIAVSVVDTQYTDYTKRSVIITPEAGGGEMIVAGKSRLKGDLNIEGVARVMPAGDIGMGEFAVGTTPLDNN